MIVNPVRYVKGGAKTVQAEILNVSEDSDIFYMQSGVMITMHKDWDGDAEMKADRGSMIVIYNISSEYSQAGRNVTRLRSYGGMSLYQVDA